MDRGDAYRALGAFEEARGCYEKALELAEAHRLGQFLVQSEKAIRALDGLFAPAERKTELPAASSLGEIEDIRVELDRMCQRTPALAGVC
jgi:tetratricopeptide (TPR) repeat protein